MQWEVKYKLAGCRGPESGVYGARCGDYRSLSPVRRLLDRPGSCEKGTNGKIRESGAPGLHGSDSLQVRATGNGKNLEAQQDLGRGGSSACDKGLVTAQLSAVRPGRQAPPGLGEPSTPLHIGGRRPKSKQRTGTRPGHRPARHGAPAASEAGQGRLLLPASEKLMSQLGLGWGQAP